MKLYIYTDSVVVGPILNSTLVSGYQKRVSLPWRHTLSLSLPAAVYTFLTLGACARGTVVGLCVCVYLSVTALTATYIILKSKVRYHRGLHGVFNICNVWLSLKTLYSKVMASFTYHGCLPRSLTSSRRT